MSVVTVIQWFGFAPEQKTSFTTSFINLVLQFSMVVMYVDVIVMFIVGVSIDNFLFKIVLEKIYSISCSMIVLGLLLRKRRPLAALLKKTSFICHPNTERKINIITGSFWMLLFSYGAMFLFISKYSGDDYAFVFFFYKIPMESEVLKYLITYSKAFLYFFFYPTFPNITILVFCTLCHRCSHSLRNLSKELEKCPPKAFTVDVQIKYLKCRRKIVKLLQKTQDIFSLITFVICSASFSCCFAMLGQLIFYSFKHSGLSFLSDTIFNSVSALLSLTVLFWIPGEVPIEMEKLSHAARKKYELRASFGIGSENPSIERALCEEKAFVLSGFNLVHFTKESVLTVMGTILTYGLLLTTLDLQSFPKSSDT
ncbi:uncharacterized protein TNIN_201601 [Trichonephila inaurata madagascariensis]|uniref:Gustatory receptor n=1 Tax=Trichonephila inaurata madagascariensis TaxID=2747483 RepID=A0A8X6YVL3_9ARAC|nr:uncharacterized protein TNIN_201601 [Trichonephila inaurata madagascariensis]